MNELFVSVIIPTYNREKCILDLLKVLFVQDHTKYELIIIDQSSELSAEKKDFIRTHKNRLRYFHISERGRSLAKNYGILQAKGDIVLFCDDDIIPEPNFLSTHVANYKDEKIGAVSCRLVEEGQLAVPIDRPLKATFYGKLINKPYSTSSGYVTSLNGGNMSFRKSVLDKVGFFEEYFEGTSMVEESDIAYRVLKCGYKIYFNAGTTVMHYPQQNGNIAYMQAKRAEWFYFYFYNLLVYFVKYGRFSNLPFVFMYSLLLSAKHSVRYRIPLVHYFKMISGFFNGMKKGYSIYADPVKGIYFSPCRYKKEYINEIIL